MVGAKAGNRKARQRRHRSNAGSLILFAFLRIFFATFAVKGFPGGNYSAREPFNGGVNPVESGPRHVLRIVLKLAK